MKKKKRMKLRDVKLISTLESEPDIYTQIKMTKRQQELVEIENLCDDCKDRECKQCAPFVNIYNLLYDSDLLLRSCPDKIKRSNDNIQATPDLIYIDRSLGENIVIEIKRLHHGFDHTNSKQSKRNPIAWKNQLEPLKLAISQVVNDMLAEQILPQDIRVNYVFHLEILTQYNNRHLKQIFPMNFKNFLINKFNEEKTIIYKDSYYKVTISKEDAENRLMHEDILFSCPTNIESVDDGINMEEIFKAQNDYKKLWSELISLIKKNNQKFDEYKEYNRIFLFIYTPKYPMEMFLKMEFPGLNHKNLLDGLSLLSKRFHYDFADKFYILFNNYLLSDDPPYENGCLLFDLALGKIVFPPANQTPLFYNRSIN